MEVAAAERMLVLRKFVASLPQKPVFYQPAVEMATDKHVHHVSVALLAKVTSGET